MYTTIRPKMNASGGNVTSTIEPTEGGDDFPLELTVITYVIIVLGFSANGFICAAFIFYRKIRTVNNYFVFNLAISDLFLIVSLCLVMALPKIGETLSKDEARKAILFLIIFETFCGSASIANLTVISYDRYYAVTKPLLYHAQMTHRKAVLFIISIWFYAAAAGLLQLVQLLPNPDIFKYGYMPLLAVFNVLIPLNITLYCYTTIFIIASRHLRHNPHINLDASSAASLLSKNLKIAFNIFILVAPLLVCWNIFYIITVVENFCDNCEGGTNSCCIPLTTYFSNWIISDMAHILATIDPIVYICLTKDFRKIIFGWFGRRRRPYLASETFHLSTTYSNNNSNSPSERRMIEIR